MITVSIDLMLNLLANFKNFDEIRDRYSCSITQHTDPETLIQKFTLKFTDPHKETMFRVRYSEYI